MTFSKLASGTVPAHGKFSSRGGNTPQRLIVHHWAGVGGGDARLVDPNANVSCSYILYSTGALIGQVHEEYRPFTSGSPGADNPSITVETQNTGGRFPGAGDNDSRSWPVSDAALEMLAQLAADLCVRYRWGRLDRNRVRGHREFDSTACPGGYLWHRLEYIINRGNQIIEEGEDDMFSDDDRALLRQTAQKANASYDALFKETPTSRGSSAGVLSVLGKIEGPIRATYDAQFIEKETSRGTPGGTLVNDRHMLAKLDAIIEHFGIEVEPAEPVENGEDDVEPGDK